MSRSAKCPVVGCPGIVEYTTNGRGADTSHCPCCEKREAWKAVNLPDVVRTPCVICSGPITVVRHGARKKYCPACKKLVVRKERVQQYERAKTPPALKVSA